MLRLTPFVVQWHLGFYQWEYTPTFRGFDSYYGYYEGGMDYFSHQGLTLTLTLTLKV